LIMRTDGANAAGVIKVEATSVRIHMYNCFMERLTLHSTHIRLMVRE
jgi:hypothetical protein